jgi:FkbM family methyltransferase
MHTLILKDNMALVAGRDGYFLVSLNDMYIGRGLACYGEYNAAEAAFLKRLIKPGDHVVEVGANIGAHTIGLAKAVGPHGKVYAFEPQRVCFALLQAQVALNQAYNVFAYNQALSRSPESLWMPAVDYTQTENFGGVALMREGGSDAEAAAVTTLDERLNGVPCALIKIDVEGMEEDVIRGGLNLIRTHRPLLYVENDQIAKSQSLIACIQELGYRLWWHIPKLYSPQNFFNMSENIFGETASFNMICSCRELEAVEGLKEIKSPHGPHPSAPQSRPAWQYSINMTQG